jgi:hypothetical protein
MSKQANTSVHCGSYLFGDSVVQESVSKHCYGGGGGSGRRPRGCRCSGIRTGKSSFSQEQTAWLLLRLRLYLGRLCLAASSWATWRGDAETSDSRRCWCCSSCTGASGVQALHPLMCRRAAQYQFRHFHQNSLVACVVVHLT